MCSVRLQEAEDPRFCYPCRVERADGGGNAKRDALDVDNEEGLVFETSKGVKVSVSFQGVERGDLQAKPH